MHWNYRIVRYLDTDIGYGLHEIYYDEAGKPTSMSVNAVTFVSEDPAEIRDALAKALDCAHTKPIFDEPVGWKA